VFGAAAKKKYYFNIFLNKKYFKITATAMSNMLVTTRKAGGIGKGLLVPKRFSGILGSCSWWQLGGSTHAY
jgi:hypothetical protein